MKSLYKSLTAWLLCLFFVFSSFIVSFADVKSLMIGSSSNALMTLELDDSDYLMMSPRSSIASIQNTVTNGDMQVIAYYYKDGDDEGIQYQAQVTPEYKQGGWTFRLPQLASDCYYSTVIFVLFKDALPSPGTYYFSFDYSSDFSYDYKNFDVLTIKRNTNASQQASSLYPSYQFSSGDVYCPAFKLNLTNLYQFNIYVRMKNDDVRNFAGTYKVNFTPTTSDSSAPSTAGTNTSGSDYQDDVSSSLSDLSSSVDSMTEDLSSAAQNLEYISTSQNLIIQGIDNVIMHISDQLYAFWDQLFNLIHLPTLAKMDDIISAINNMDLEIEVNLDGLKSTINNMSTAIQNKLQSVSDKITGGYDNSGMVSENNELSGAVDELDQAEKEVLDNVSGYITDFEYPSFDSISTGIIGALSFFGGFLHSMFLSMGSFGLIITFSLTMIFVLIIVGYHRIRN